MSYFNPDSEERQLPLRCAMGMYGSEDGAGPNLLCSEEIRNPSESALGLRLKDQAHVGRSAQAAQRNPVQPAKGASLPGIWADAIQTKYVVAMRRRWV